MLTLYGYPMTRSTRVLWALEEADADYQFIKVKPSTDAKEPAYLKINPAGKVPALVNGDFVMTESAAICTYIAELHPDAQLIPEAGSQQRAEYNQWCFFAMTELEQPLWDMVKHGFILPKEYRLPKMLITANYEFNKTLATFDQQLGDREYLVGNKFSCADVILASILKWAKNYDKEDNFNWASRTEDYRDRLTTRDAFQRVLAMEKHTEM